MARSTDEIADEVDEIAHVIGRTVICCAILEKAASRLIAAHLELDERAERALVTPLQMRAKTDILRRLIKPNVTAEKQKEFEDTIFKPLNDLADERNGIIHGEYVHHNETFEFHVLTYQGKHRLTGKPKKLTVEYITSLYEKALDLGEMLDEHSQLIRAASKSRAEGAVDQNTPPKQ